MGVRAGIELVSDGVSVPRARDSARRGGCGRRAFAVIPPVAELVLVVVMVPLALVGGRLFDQTFRPQIAEWAAKRIPDVRLDTILSDPSFQADLPGSLGTAGR